MKRLYATLASLGLVLTLASCAPAPGVSNAQSGPQLTAPPAASSSMDAGESSTAETSETGERRIRLRIGEEEAVAVLDDCAAARDLLALLPLELTFEDYNGTEKISYLPRALDTTGAPDSFDPDRGDLTLYAPWGNLAIFYRDFRPSSGLVPLGRIVEGLDVLTAREGTFTAVLEEIPG